MNRFLLIIFLATVGISVQAQEYLVTPTFLGTKTKLELLLTFGIPVEYDVDMYKLTYKTPGIDLLPDTASGLLVIPKAAAGTAFPIVVYDHGTTSGPQDVPSNLSGGYELALAYAAFGFITVAPDYLGMGESRGFHPYVHAATEASASFDILNATVEYLEEHEAEWNVNYLFLTGYSQGGHASMAFHRELETFWQFVYPVTASTHMSGPYSISGIMKNRMLGDEPYGNPAYIAYLFLGMNEVYNLHNETSEFFKPEYVNDVNEFYAGTINLDVLNSRLLTTLQGGSPKNMIQDDIINAITNDPQHAINLALAENDTYNWAPSTPTRLYYCGMDTQVPFENAILAELTMNTLGAPDVLSVNHGANLDHGPCVLPSAIASITFFRGFLSTSTTSVPTQEDYLDIFPNPTSEFLYLNWETATGEVDYTIVNMQGVVLKQGTTGDQYVRTNDLANGVYSLICKNGEQTKFARFVKI